MAFLREMMSILMVSVWVGTVMSATTTTTTTPATNVLDARPKGATAGLLPTTGGSKADGVAQSLAANPGELSAPCRQAISGMAKNEALATCTNLFDMVQIRTAKDSISAPIKAWITGMCAAPACVPASLTTASEQFKTGCAVEMNSGSMDAAAFYSILTTYQTIRTDACPNIEKLDFCDQTLAGHIKKWSKQERPFFSVQKAAYCMECGPKIANQPQPESKSGKNSTKHPLCRGTASGSNTAGGVLGKPIVVALPGPNGSAKPTKPPKSS